VSNERVISEWWIGKNLEGSGGGLILRFYPGILLEGLRTTSVRIAGLRAEILNRDLPNTKQDWTISNPEFVQPSSSFHPMFLTYMFNIIHTPTPRWFQWSPYRVFQPSHFMLALPRYREEGSWKHGNTLKGLFVSEEGLRSTLLIIDMEMITPIR
jgi:hypothetical protein